MQVTTPPWFLAACLAILAGCASLDGHSLVAGKSTEAEVIAFMGAPAARIRRPDGDEVLYFARHPEGRVCYAVIFGRNSVMKGIEQRLSRANFAKILVGKSTRDQVRELIGPPSSVMHLQLKGRDVWQYPWLEFDEKRVLFVEFSADGLVIRVDEFHDQDSDRPSMN